MLKKIYSELVLIRKELQAINGSKELDSNVITNGKITASSIKGVIKI